MAFLGAVEHGKNGARKPQSIPSTQRDDRCSLFVTVGGSKLRFYMLARVVESLLSRTLFRALI